LSTSEMDFIHRVVRQVIEHRVDNPPPGAQIKDRQAELDLYSGYFDKMLDRVQKEVAELMTEAVSEAESRQRFVISRLKQRCFEVFQTFQPAQQRELLDAVDGLLWSDGEAHPAELELRHGLIALLEEELEDASERVPYPRNTEVEVLQSLPREAGGHPFLTNMEQHYPEDGEDLGVVLDEEQVAVHAVQSILGQQRLLGKGRLGDRVRVDELQDEPPFLDGHLWWQPAHPERRYELTVLGDLHGCYSCLKAALVQSAFFERLEAFRRNPHKAPEPKLVLLGDYLDRGHLGFEGVVRTAFRLFCAAPDHVFVLRGNHEDFSEDDSGALIDSAVRPAESIEAFRPVAPFSLLRSYAETFRALPHALLFGRILFTHGGLPADGVIETSERTLASLNHALTAFQMRWSDPSVADVIPRSMQAESYRFGYGRLQAQAFMQRLGCHTLIRGHEKVEEGFVRKFEDSHILLITLFSAGGKTNLDLPERSSYRKVRPMALTIHHEGGLDGPTRIEAWPIDYAAYNDGEHNGFYADVSG
ncbi:MAG: metallophosphoesterase family protein, partial [Polyangia bacterium]|nr:metallophosphoesterase family protein [Polyangia bacterium]